MIKNYLKMKALEHILEMYEVEIEKCIEYHSSECINDVIEKYNELITGLFENGKNRL